MWRTNRCFFAEAVARTPADYLNGTNGCSSNVSSVSRSQTEQDEEEDRKLCRSWKHQWCRARWDSAWIRTNHSSTFHSPGFLISTTPQPLPSHRFLPNTTYRRASDSLVQIPLPRVTQVGDYFRLVFTLHASDTNVALFFFKDFLSVQVGIYGIVAFPHLPYPMLCWDP